MTDPQKQRESLLEEMAGIETMARGRLSEEYRQRRENGRTIRLGPYYKHQVWEDGRNRSRRVKAEEAEKLREGIEGLDKFKQLADQYVEATIELGEQRHREHADAKKNSG